MTARERRVRELVALAIKECTETNGAGFKAGIATGAACVAARWYDSEQKFTRSFNAALAEMSRAAKRAAKGRK
jgi:uncharacterized protein (UPF0254 family)